MSDPDLSPLAPPLAAPTLPEGEYAIVELFGHTTLIGRIQEVERFGTKLLMLEPLFNDTLLGPSYHGGAAIYRLTPCSREVAWTKQPRHDWQLPAAIRAVLPPNMLPAPETKPESIWADDVEEAGEE